MYTFTLTRVSIGTNLDYPCSLARDGATLFVLPLGISTHCYDNDIHNPSELEANADPSNEINESELVYMSTQNSWTAHNALIYDYNVYDVLFQTFFRISNGNRKESIPMIKRKLISNSIGRLYVL